MVTSEVFLLDLTTSDLSEVLKSLVIIRSEGNEGIVWSYTNHQGHVNHQTQQHQKEMTRNNNTRQLCGAIGPGTGASMKEQDLLPQSNYMEPQPHWDLLGGTVRA